MKEISSGEKQILKNRDPFFDNTKTLLMILVVFGHILPIDLKNWANIATYEWVFSFHMPLFVFISGYFSKTQSNVKFWIGILKLFETLIVFDVILIGILILLGRKVLIDSLYTPKWVLWYLLSLIWWRVILYITPTSLRNNHKWLVLMSLFICILAGWIPLGPELAFQRTFYFLPFFILGYVVRQRKIIDKLRCNSLLAYAMLIIVWLFFFLIRVKFSHIFHQNYGYMHENNEVLAMCIRIVVFMVGCAMSVCFLSIIPKKRYIWTRWGQFTLFIYAWHSVILVSRYGIRDFLHLPTSLPFCVLYTIIVLAVIFCMSRIRFFHFLLNPITTCLNIG